MSDQQPTPKLTDALWRIYHRPNRPIAWTNGGNLPWNDPNFSARMLREHLDESHGAATRVKRERNAQLDWLWSHLNLQPGMTICDLTCGPGFYAVDLAQRGCTITGVDFSPRRYQLCSCARRARQCYRPLPLHRSRCARGGSSSTEL